MTRLVAPTMDRHAQWRAFAAEFDGEHIPGAAVLAVDVPALADPLRFHRWLAEKRDQESGKVAPGFVPASLRWVLDEQDRLVGTIHLRHRLTNGLLREGGHIGYAVAPSARRRGHAGRALALMLELARQHGIRDALLTCDDDNVGSARTIEGSGGVLANVLDGKRRYWIPVLPDETPYAATPLTVDPLVGRLVELRLADAEVVAAMHAAGPEGGAAEDWAPGFPREDDLDGCPLPTPGTEPGPWGARLVVRRADGLVVGTLGFYGPPDAAGEVEVGYGLVEQARRQGLVSDALALVLPAARLAGARSVRAHTEKDNVASQNLLLRNGFRALGPDGSGEVLFRL